MIGKLKRLLGGGAPQPPQFDAPLVIDRPTYAIGDVHGRFDLLILLMRQIVEDAAERGIDAPRIVLMGDYVDRGEQSAEVLAFLQDLRDDEEEEVIALRGNHEEMLLEFLASPGDAGGRWLRNGGLQTLHSYGVGGVTQSSDAGAMAAAATQLETAMAPVLEMVRDLPSHARFGDVLFAHAGADPELPLDMQNDFALVWGASRFLKAPRADGIWVVHGHYVVDEAEARSGRIPVDTGAYFSGRLTAARLMDGEVAFLST